jgi:hypothetical protein
VADGTDVHGQTLKHKRGCEVDNDDCDKSIDAKIGTNCNIVTFGNGAHKLTIEGISLKVPGGFFSFVVE